MRLDKFLKVSRIIKRRTVANEACSGGRVSVNGRTAKPAADIKEGDVLEIRFGNRVGRYRVASVKEVVRKENAQDMYEVLEEDAQTKAERGQE
ncbi:MAG: RNA-binding S4 domain-containing protein [Eubacteriales bacterium]|nr:RNA-binding S4 domain-containing protein [Eubacteriales bacterium]